MLLLWLYLVQPYTFHTFLAAFYQCIFWYWTLPVVLDLIDLFYSTIRYLEHLCYLSDYFLCYSVLGLCLCAIQFCLFLFPCHSYCVQLASSNAQYHRACFIMVFNFHACMCVEVSFMLSYETLLIGSNTSNISTIIGKYWCESNIIITDKLIYLGICINEYTNERGMRISISWHEYKHYSCTS